MTSHTGNNGIHPLLSSLLGQVPPKPNFVYSREDMLKIKADPLSQMRPENLSKEFDTENGLFSPSDWLQKRWEVEGFKTKPQKTCDGDENASSGQRRHDGKEDRTEKGAGDRLGGGGKIWRNGSSGGADKAGNAKGDFKLPFQKTGQQNRGDWKKDNQRNANSKYGYRRDDRSGSVGTEKLPEWADGPTTMDDMIELRGFDEPKKGKKKNVKENNARKDKETKNYRQGSASNSRPSSAGIPGSQGLAAEDSAVKSSEVAASSSDQYSLPASDHELAALLGIIDLSSDIDKRNVASVQEGTPAPSSGSRLLKYLKNGNTKEREHDEQAPPALSQMFGHYSKAQAAGSLEAMNKGVRLEDIEQGAENKQPKDQNELDRAKTNPLEDPQQQAKLLDQLQRLSKQQGADNNGEAGQANMPTTSAAGAQGALQLQQMMMAAARARGMANVPQRPPIQVPVQLLARFAQNPALINSHIEVQLQHAVATATAASNGQLHPQIVEQLKVEALRNRAFLQQQVYQFAIIQQQHQQQQQQQMQAKRSVPAAMIPASVQRQLTKSNSNAASQDEKKGKNPAPPTTENGTDQNEQIWKKLQMQNHYAAIMNAMQGGLGMAAMRPPQAPLQQTQPDIAAAIQANLQGVPENVQRLLVAQAHAAQAVQIEQARKIMAMQHLARQNVDFKNEKEKMVPTQSELSQVGPIQTPLEKLLVAAGVQPTQFNGAEAMRPPPTVRPMTLEELEKGLSSN